MSEVILAITTANSNDTTAGDTEFEKLSGRQASAALDGEDAKDEGGSAADVRASTQQGIPNLLTGLEYRGGRSFTIRIANGRTFVFETLGGAMQVGW